MQKRILGKSGLKITELGIGTWQLAGDENCWVKPATKKESLDTLHYTLDKGINFIDTALVYGDGMSETWIGEVLKERGYSNAKETERPIIASKVYPKNRQWPARKEINIDEVFPVKWIHEAVDESLSHLDIDRIDVMQFHVWQDDWAERDEWKAAVQDIIERGKVKNWALSLNDYQPDNCLKTIETGLITSLQLIFNIFHQEPVEAIFKKAAEKNVGIIARVPLDEGSLAGKIDVNTRFEKGDFRSRFFGGERLVELDKRVKALKKLVEESDEVESLLEMALRYTISFPEVTTTIPGMRIPRYVETAIAAVDKGPLSEDLLEKLKSHAWERNFY